jgi:PelA/Pel-15E family pectate lyase
MRRPDALTAFFIFFLAASLATPPALAAASAVTIPPAPAPTASVCPPDGRTSVDRDAILASVKKAARFLMETVSNRGGFLSVYASDLSEQWGEIPARKSQVWVQSPGTVSMGELMLEAWRATGDPEYLRMAEKTAGVLVFGQRPEGGWHYFIDFDPRGIPEYYEQIASKCWGWEEFYHYDDNSTFDDDVHAGATRFLMSLYLATLDPRWRGPLDKALEFALKSQFANGAWPQRFPLRDDYSSYYTFNDGVIINNIHLLLEACEKLGDTRFREAARRGMEFVVEAQGAPPQAGWALQYDKDMKPAKARNYEPAALSVGQTLECIRNLEVFYEITGDREFLRGIPDAIKWLERSTLGGGAGAVYQGKKYTHATFYEPGTNQPLYSHRKKSLAEVDPNDPDGGYWVDNELGNFTEHYGEAGNIDVAAVKREFERVSALGPAEARAEAEEEMARRDRPEKADADEAAKIFGSMDARGAWVEDVSVKYFPDFRDRSKGRTIRAIQIGTAQKNISALLDSLRN